MSEEEVKLAVVDSLGSLPARSEEYDAILLAQHRFH
jgi:hypothetical protein